MRPTAPHRLAAVVAVAAALALAGCSSDGSGTAGADDAAGGATTAVVVPQEAVVVDVRTPEEYAAGHVEGAINLDVQSDGFDARLATLDPAAATFVYCRTGNRSAAAAERMADAGFDDVTDLGSLQEASEATGLPIVG